MFDDQAGIGHILQGRGEPGVRSKGQADLLARLGSARPKNRAVIVEEAAESWMAAEHEGKERTAEEISQLLYHAQCLMLASGIGLADVYEHL